MKRFFMLPVILCVSLAVHAQCDVKERVLPDGSLHRYITPVQLYHTTKQDLYGGLMTDGESYFVELRITPKPDPMPQKTWLALSLHNKQTYKLDLFDMRTSSNDSILVLVYRLPKDKISDFAQHELTRITITYDSEKDVHLDLVPKLHKQLFMQHLACLVPKK